MAQGGGEQPGNQLLPPDRSMENGIGKKKGLEAAQSLMTTLAGARPQHFFGKWNRYCWINSTQQEKFFGTRREQPGNQLSPPDRSMENGIGKKKGLKAAQSLMTTLTGATPVLLWKNQANYLCRRD